MFSSLNVTRFGDRRRCFTLVGALVSSVTLGTVALLLFFCCDAKVSFVVGSVGVVFCCSISAICSSAFLVGSPAAKDMVVVDGGVWSIEMMSPAACLK